MVRDAVVRHIEVMNVQYERLHTMLDTMRAGSTASPHMATWMKELVYALPPPGTAVERPLGTLAMEDTVCTTTGRVLRPWALQLLITQMVRANCTMHVWGRGQGYSAGRRQVEICFRQPAHTHAART